MAIVVCAKCKVAMKPLKTGVVHVTMFGNPPEPYEARRADLFHCIGCGAQIVCQFARDHYWVHFEGKPLMERGDWQTYEYERLADVPSELP